MNLLKLAATLLLVTPASARNLRAGSPSLTQKRFLKDDEYSAVCIIDVQGECDLDERDLEKAAEDALDEVYEDDSNSNSGEDRSRRRRMKNNDESFGFVVEKCSKKEIEDEVEDAVSSAYSSDNSEDSRDDDAEIDLTCFVLPEGHSRNVCPGIDWVEVANLVAEEASKRKCVGRRRRLSSDADATLITVEGGSINRSASCSVLEAVEGFLAEMGC